MTEFARCPAFNIECQYVAEVDRLSAENERLRYELRCIFRDYQSCMADEWIADVRAALGETK
jgi:hypothetical protein